MYQQAEEAVRKLKNAGYKAYFAGGMVRDMLLGVSSKDIDIATSATFDEISSLFPNVIEVGKQFGICVVIENGMQMEIATFRREDGYSDSRRPDRVYPGTPEEDVKRRDFTINGMLYDPTNGELIDLVGGREDIKKKVIRFIGNPNERIQEDHLRLVRAIRFKITLGFQYDKFTFESVRKNASLLKSVSTERLRDELIKIFDSSNRAQGLIELSESGLLGYILPEIEQMKGVEQPAEYHREGDVFKHTYLALKNLRKDAPSFLAIATLLHDVGKPETFMSKEETGDRIRFSGHAEKSGELARTILKKLKFSNYEINTIAWLVENHMRIFKIKEMRPAKKRDFLLDPRFQSLIELTIADASGTIPVDNNYIEFVQNVAKEAKELSEAERSRPDIDLLNGDDLIAIGMEPSKKFKQILEAIQDMQLEGKLKNKEEAIEYAKKNF